jgi:hypothetical protein
MRKIGLAVLLASGLLVSPDANAQSWGGYSGYGQGYGAYDRLGGYWNNGAGDVCSGQRARSLEAKLRHEYNEGEIDGYAAERLSRQIDRLERKRYHECREGDWNAIRNISFQYNRIDQWIDQRAHGRWRGDY